jgi:hypothetical protein
MDPVFAHPEQWGGFPFWRGGTEVPKQLSTLAAPDLKKRPMLPLGQTLRHFGMDTSGFVRLIRSCFDAEQSGELVLIAMDPQKEGAEEMALQLLGWLFRFLPMAMRRRVDCTTCLGQGWTGHAVVGFVPLERIQVKDGKLTVSGGLGLAGGGTLFARGRVERLGNKPTRPTVAGSLYGQWLESLVAWVEKRPAAQAERGMRALNQVYLRFDDMIASLPEGERCKLNYYDALCWNYLMSAGDETAKRVPARGDLAYFEDLLAFGSWPEVVRSVGKMLDALESLYVAPASARLIRLMTKIVQLDGVEEDLSRAQELLTVFLSRDMEVAEIGESSAVSAKYLQLMASGGMSRAEALEYLERSFFPDKFPVSPELRSPQLWHRLGTSRLSTEGARRCSDWVGSYANLALNAEELMECPEIILRELDGFQPELLSLTLDALLGAQEARCYYAKLEILPTHLTTCCRCISQVRETLPKDYWAVAERYYTKLFLQLGREYLAYWRGNYTLVGICDLMTEFRREGRGRNEDGLMKELIVAQCNAICEYDWDTLKECMGKENEEILQRLWQVLDQLEEFWLGGDLGEQLCSQICRYVLHALPPYVNDHWLVAQTEVRQGLPRRGYYLELLALREFLGSSEQSLEQLQRCIRVYHVPGGAMQDMMKVLYRLFGRGGLERLELVALQGIYVASAKRLKASQLEVFRAVCQVRGGAALLTLLENWPSAPVAEEVTGFRRKRVEGKRRGGAYSWLKTDENLLSALEQLSRDKAVLMKAAEGTENFFFRLMEEVNQLAPVGTCGRKTAVQINTNLLELLEKKSGFATRVLCGSRKRTLLAE